LHGIETKIVEFLTTLIQGIGWPGVAVIMALESANIPIPSEVTMPLAGWMWCRRAHERMGGGVVGRTVRGDRRSAASFPPRSRRKRSGLPRPPPSTALRRPKTWDGRPLLERYGRWIMVSEEDLVNTDKWFVCWGDLTASRE